MFAESMEVSHKKVTIPAKGKVTSLYVILLVLTVYRQYLFWCFYCNRFLRGCQTPRGVPFIYSAGFNGP